MHNLSIYLVTCRERSDASRVRGATGVTGPGARAANFTFRSQFGARDGQATEFDVRGMSRVLQLLLIVVALEPSCFSTCVFSYNRLRVLLVRQFSPRFSLVG
jgi:hypothetical protein